ncbi:MAG TPA: ABC transporter permease [Candidatus Acidoferrum sp.]|nr:ABC transporter permease [Candidatus Acidoferrum sp.]
MLADLRQAVRGLRKAPALAAVAIASLALGIGANVTAYSIAREMIFQDISAVQPDRLARIDTGVTYARYRDLRAAGVFQDLAFDTGFHDAIWQRTNRNEVIWAMDTSPNFFDLLGIHPAAGRLYTQHDEGSPVAVVSHGFWRKRLASDPAALGRTLQVNGHPYTLIGILPSDYRSVMGHGVAPEIYAPARLDSQQRCHPFGRLRDGMTRTQARESLTGFPKEPPPVGRFSGFGAYFVREGDDYRMLVFFMMLVGIALMLALIACSNVAGLLFARRAARYREMRIRQALGANRWQLARPLFGEALVLAVCGAAAGLVLDAWLRSQLRYLRWPTAYNIPFEFHFESDHSLFLYALLTACAALLICFPAGAVKPPSPGWNVRSGFVALQVVLSMVLLTLGALFARSFLHVANLDVGFDAVHTVIATVHPPPRADRGWAWRQRLADAIRRVPGVEGVTSTDLLPLMGEVHAAPVRRADDPSSAARDIYAMAEGEQYFATLRIPILRGRDFEITDRDRKPTPAIINRTLARQFFAGADPIGAHLIRGREKEDVLEIVGVAADTKMRTLGEAAAPAFFTPDYNGQFLVRVSGDPVQWTEPLRRALAAADPAPALDIRPLRDAVAGALLPMKMAAAFVTSLGVIGLVLALVGIYGSVSYAVSRRTREFGIRAALGATHARILWTALRDSTLLLTAGATAGLLLAIAAFRPLVDLLPDGVDPWDPRLFAAAALALIASGVVGAAIPARHAAKVDCAAALRQE